MKSLIIIIFLAIITISGFPQQNELTKFVDSIASRYQMEHFGLALVIGINNNGKEQVFYYGDTKKGNRQKPDSLSIFEIGEITEAFTSALFADRAMQGKIHMDDPIQKFLPVETYAPVYRELICKPEKEPDKPDVLLYHERAFIRYTPYLCLPDPSSTPQPILLCYLSTHTSGLPEVPGNLRRHSTRENIYAKYTKENLYDFLDGYRLFKPIGIDYRYSMVGIALLGHALELNEKTSYDSLLTQRLLMPMGLHNTGLNLSSEEQQKHFVTGHDSRGYPVQHWTYQVFAPALGLRSSVADMMHFLDLNIREQKDSIVYLLDYTHNPRLRITSPEMEQGIALGWKISPLGIEGKDIVWQSGHTSGFASYIGFVTTNRTGVIVLSNSVFPVNEMGNEILKKVNAVQLKKGS